MSKMRVRVPIASASLLQPSDGNPLQHHHHHVPTSRRAAAAPPAHHHHHAASQQHHPRSPRASPSSSRHRRHHAVDDAGGGHADMSPFEPSASGVVLVTVTSSRASSVRGQSDDDDDEYDEDGFPHDTPRELLLDSEGNVYLPAEEDEVHVDDDDDDAWTDDDSSSTITTTWVLGFTRGDEEEEEDEEELYEADALHIRALARAAKRERVKQKSACRNRRRVAACKLEAPHNSRQTSPSSARTAGARTSSPAGRSRRPSAGHVAFPADPVVRAPPTSRRRDACQKATKRVASKGAHPRRTQSASCHGATARRGGRVPPSPYLAPTRPPAIAPQFIPLPSSVATHSTEEAMDLFSQFRLDAC